ncbi:ABC transporter substrate-binding protein [Paenarthrobacter sp. Z7-10]|uniref:ABC transporter substrate-binding protein n=1 Tax=Paenarthrobacter sp. Z7-10 TaxID=2787635 RepID=UPI0022A90634|nr:ABC transporter substrate-binding protein [Paenarthrobacter sp. Z7-10]MCZ2401624.1 ABC transporter substrate-binding protein [Paenarthrobacter sp. Z7-10]
MRTHRSTASVQGKGALARRWRSTRLAAAVLVTAGALALTSCTTGADTGGSAGGTSGSSTFNIGIGVDLDTVDPAQQTTTTVQNVVDYGVETLVSLDKDGKVTPGLAESWDTSSDGQTLTLHLRKGVTFQDGTAFDAKAAKFNLDRITGGKVKVPIGGAFKVIDKVEAPDDATVAIHMKYPDPSLLQNLGITTSGIISPASATKDGNSFEIIVKPVGTGPYEFIKFQKGTQVTYKKYDKYWGEKPYYSDVVFKIIPEASSREAGLRSGQLQMIMNPPISDLKALSSSPGLATVNPPSDRSIFIAFNNQKAPFNNPKVREAFNYAVNKEAIIKNVLFGAATLMDSPMPAALDGYCKVGDYSYDPAKAKQLLADAGATNLSITFGAPTGRYLQDQQAAQAIAADLRAVGVTVKVSTMDWPSYTATMEDPKGPFDMHMLGWAPGALDAPTQFQMFQKASWPPAGLNSAFYTNPEVEKTISTGEKELDKTKRDAAYCDAQKQIWADAPWTFLWSQTLSLAYQSNIAGITSTPNEKFDTVYAHPAK